MTIDHGGLWDQPPQSWTLLGVGIGGIGSGRRVFAHRPNVVCEVCNFTDFFPRTYLLPDTVTGASVTVIG
jgi:hypothetical protein